MGVKRKPTTQSVATAADSDSDYEVDRYVKAKPSLPEPTAESDEESDTVNASEDEDTNKALPNITRSQIEALLRDRTSKRLVLCVENVDFKTVKEEIAQHFAQVGVVKSVRIPKFRKSGYAFVEMNDIDSFHRSFSLHNTILNGRPIKIKMSEGGSKKTENKKKALYSRNKNIMKMRFENKFQTQGGKSTVTTEPQLLPQKLKDPKVAGLGSGSFSGPIDPIEAKKSRSGKTTLYHPSKKKLQAKKRAGKANYKMNKMKRRSVR